MFMKNNKILVGEDNLILRATSQEVRMFDRGLRDLAVSMKKTLKKADGLGLAAPQVGENIRMFLITLGYGSNKEIIVPVVNPEILGVSEERGFGEEGCLSLPGIYAQVERFMALKVRFQDLEGNVIEMELDRLDARIFQHELDHLDGVLFVDHLQKDAVTENLLM